MTTSGAAATAWTLTLFLTCLISSLDRSIAFAPPRAFFPRVVHSPASVTVTAPTAAASTSTQLCAKGGALNCKPIGIGSAAPRTVVTNVDLENFMDTSDEWIQTRTGIAQRHLLTADEKLHDLSIAAAKQALDMAGIDATQLGIIICATSSADDIFGDATTIANQLGCTTDTFAYDLVAACSGFLFGTVTAGKFLSAPNSETKYALVVGADALSRWVDWDDRNSCILFGDGSGAMVLTACDSAEEPGILGYSAHSNGGGYGDLYCGYVPEPRELNTPQGTTVSSGKYGRLTMQGREVYKFATREVPKVITEALEAGGLTVDDVDWLLLHQANIRIMEVVADRLGIPMSKVITNLSKYGNTSSASIPLALDEAVRQGLVKKGDVIACAGFGAGLSWGSCIFKWGG